MRAEVRDDIIALDTFVKARFYYEKYIDVLHQAGGYCFLDQWIQHYGGENKGRYLAEQLEENGLIKTKALNNYKYCYLTDAALKYLKYKDDPRDFSEMKKANIPIKKLTPTPSEKVLMSSSMKFALIQKYAFFRKDRYKTCLITFYSSAYNKVVDENKIIDDKIIFDDDKSNVNERVNKMIDKSISYFDKSKVVFNPNGSILDMIILDTGTLKTASAYIDSLNEYLDAIEKFDFKQYRIIIASFSEKRAKKFINDIIKEKDNRIRSLSNILNNEAYIYIQPKPFRLKKITSGAINNCYYMKEYLNKVGKGVAYLKKKDIDTFTKLKEQLELNSK